MPPLPPRQRSLLEIFGLKKPNEDQRADDERRRRSEQMPDPQILANGDVLVPGKDGQRMVRVPVGAHNHQAWRRNVELAGSSSRRRSNRGLIASGWITAFLTAPVGASVGLVLFTPTEIEHGLGVMILSLPAISFATS